MRIILTFMLMLSCTIAYANAADEAAGEIQDEQIKQLVATAFKQFKAGKHKEAIASMNKANTIDPKDINVLELRALMYRENNQYDKAVSDYTQLIKLDPEEEANYQFRGVCYFNLNKFKESVADFDKYIEMIPKSEPGHWQRGISHYYAKMYAEGQKQFEVHKTVNAQDVENAVWHYLCVAKQKNAAEAEKSIIPIKFDRRIPMMKVFALFSGKATPEDVLKEAERGADEISKERLLLQRFYAHLYIGLYYEANNKPKLARKHIKLAATKYAVEGYMGNVARVHNREYEKLAKESKQK